MVINGHIPNENHIISNRQTFTAYIWMFGFICNLHKWSFHFWGAKKKNVAENIALQSQIENVKLKAFTILACIYLETELKTSQRPQNISSFALLFGGSVLKYVFHLSRTRIRNKIPKNLFFDRNESHSRYTVTQQMHRMHRWIQY